VECGITDPMNHAARECSGQQLHHLGSQFYLAGGALAAPQPEQHRQCRRRGAERQPHHDRRDHPGVPERDLLPALRGTVIGPPGLEHLAPPALKERPVARHHHRLPLAGQVLHDQLGHRQAQVTDVPDRAGEEPARPPPLPGHPAGRRRTAISQDHPARQCREQPVRRAAREHRRQLLQQIPPRRRHRQAHRRQHRRTLRSSAVY
jgi:hypothetical protein